MSHVFNILAIIPFLWTTFWYFAPYIALSIGMYYLGQVLFGQDLKEAEQSEDARSRMWDPHTTQQEGLVQACCYGRNMHHGNIVSKWTDVDGDDREILYLLLEHGDGPTKGNVADMLWLNDQPAANFGSVEVQERIGTLDQTCMTGFEKTKLEYSVNVELKYADVGNPYIWTTPNNFFNDIEYTICYPDGLMKYRENGATTHWSVYRSVRIREHPSGSWVTLFNSFDYYQRTKPLFLKYLVNAQVPGTVERGKQYDLEFKRITVDGHVRRRDKSFLRSIREVVDIPFTRPGKALTGIKAIATAQLSGSIDVKIIREDRLVNVYNGTTWEIKYSRNRAWIVWDILTQPVISGNGDALPWTIEKYEGISPANLDLEFFYNWASFCDDQVLDGYDGTEDRLACDIKVDYATNVWDLVHDIAEIGRAKLWWAGSKLTGWIDKAVDTQNLDLVTMDTIMARSWKNHWVTKDELAGVVEVFYQDKRQGYERTHVPYPKPAAGKYARIVAVEGIGITTYGTAVHVANHALTRNQLIRNVNKFRQYKDAFRHKLGDVIRLQQKIPNWGQGYRVVETTSNNTVELDRYITVAAGELVYVRSFDEVNKKVSTKIYTVASAIGNILTIAETWDVTPAKTNIVAIGISGKIVERRITKIEPTVENYFDITVETYDPVLYAADDLDPDAPYKDYIWSQPPGTLAKPVSHDDVVDLIDNLIPPQPDIEIPWLSNIEWSGNENDTIYWARRDADEEITFRFRGVDYEITPNPTTGTTDEFIYWDPNFSTEFKTTNLVSVATAPGNWCMCRNVDGVAHPTNAMMVANIGILLAGFLRVGTADIDDLAVTTAKINDLAVETLKIKDQAVTVPASVSGTSLDFTSTGENLYVHASGVIYIYHTYLTDWEKWRYTLQVKRSGNIIYNSGEMQKWTYLRYQKVHLPWSVGITDAPGAGSYVYTINLTIQESAGDLTFILPNIFIIETKK